MRSIFGFAILFTMAACNDTAPSADTAKNTDTSKPVENKIMIPKSSCYAMTNAKDTVTLKVEVFEHVVTGMLTYQLHEKDRNKGEYEGQLHGDTLIADYSFMSEGTRSVRQVAFLLRNDTATEGYGDMKEEAGKMVFTEPKNLRFGQGVMMKKVDCNY